MFEWRYIGFPTHKILSIDQSFLQYVEFVQRFQFQLIEPIILYLNRNRNDHFIRY